MNSATLILLNNRDPNKKEKRNKKYRYKNRKRDSDGKKERQYYGETKRKIEITEGIREQKGDGFTIKTN